MDYVVLASLAAMVGYLLSNGVVRRVLFRPTVRCSVAGRKSVLRVARVSLLGEKWTKLSPVHRRYLRALVLYKDKEVGELQESLDDRGFIEIPRGILEQEIRAMRSEDKLCRLHTNSSYRSIGCSVFCVVLLSICYLKCQDAEHLSSLGMILAIALGLLVSVLSGSVSAFRSYSKSALRAGIRR